VPPIVNKIMGNRLKLFGHVMRWSDSDTVRVAVKMYVEGKRERE